jgi:hypothetical protein
MIAAILAAAVCHISGQAPFLRPDDDCTPGGYKNLTLAQACHDRVCHDGTIVKMKRRSAASGTCEGMSTDVEPHRVRWLRVQEPVARYGPGSSRR